MFSLKGGQRPFEAVLKSDEADLLDGVSDETKHSDPIIDLVPVPTRGALGISGGTELIRACVPFFLMSTTPE